MGKEKLILLVNWVKTHLELSVLGLLVIFFLYVAGRVYLEYNSEREGIEPLPPWNPQELIPNENYEKATKAFSKKSSSLDEDERLYMLKSNPFDYKTVRDRDLIRKEVENKFVEAEKYFNEGNLTYALKVLREILVIWPTHQRSRELLAKVEAQLNPPTPTPSPTPRPAPAAPMPGELPPDMLVR